MVPSYGFIIFAKGKTFILNNVKVEFRSGYNENVLNFVVQEVVSETVGQYTGLSKNGTKIFEGDILGEKMLYIDGKIQIKGEKYVVEFQKGSWIIRAEDDCWVFLYPQDDLEVIGNIHDNPELLKESKTK